MRGPCELSQCVANRRGKVRPKRDEFGQIRERVFVVCTAFCTAWLMHVSFSRWFPRVFGSYRAHNH